MELCFEKKLAHMCMIVQFLSVILLTRQPTDGPARYWNECHLWRCRYGFLIGPRREMTVLLYVFSLSFFLRNNVCNMEICVVGWVARGVGRVRFQPIAQLLFAEKVSTMAIAIKSSLLSRSWTQSSTFYRFDSHVLLASRFTLKSPLFRLPCV